VIGTVAIVGFAAITLISFIFFAGRRMIAIAAGAVAFLSSGALSQAEPLFGFLSPTQNQRAALQYAPTDDATSEPQMVPRLQRQVVNYVTNEAPGTVIIDTPTPSSISWSATTKPSVTASASGAKALPGLASSRSCAKLSGRTGIRRLR